MASSCENQPVALVLALADELRSHMESATRSVGLTVEQAKMLAQLDGPRRMSELAEGRCCDPSSITSLVGRLERDGLVVRESDPTDGRVRIVVLTDHGRALRSRFFEELAARPDPFAALTSEQRRALADRLRAADAVRVGD